MENSKKYISAWTYKPFSLESPDGAFTAGVDALGEIHMGAPTIGEIKVSNGFILNSCSPSMVWSDDSRYLAVPQYSVGNSQLILVLDTKMNKLGHSSNFYRVLELYSFQDGVIHGVDSPRWQPKDIEISIEDITWE